MFEHLETPQQLFEYRLGAALTMEHDSLNMLSTLHKAAPSSKVKEMFAHHSDETREQIANLETIFRGLHMQPRQNPCPTSKGLEKEGEAMLRKSTDTLNDAVALSAALSSEHYEISAYQSLVSSAEALGEIEAASLLKKNLAQELHTSEELAGLERELVMSRTAGTM